ncbi:MAG: hypothetical protein RIS94_1407 [Pseudomonadota bacterium]|jgi:copper resistance protein B
MTFRPMLIAALLLSLATPAQAQDHAMPGMVMPSTPAPATAPPETDDATGTDQSPGSAEPPLPAHDLAASRYFGAAAMEQAHHAMTAAHGGGALSQVRFDLAEIQIRHGAQGYRWEGLAWTGGDIDRFVLRSEGEGTFGQPLARAEVQALWRHALDPWWNLEMGVRQDLESGPRRTHAVLAVEGLAPYRWDVRAQAFLSQHGELTGRVEATLDQRLTDVVVLRPRLEASWSAQGAPQLHMGRGLSEIGAGLRLHALIKPEFAPYVGWNWTRKLGRTADYARQAGDSVNDHSLVLGIATWF